MDKQPINVAQVWVNGWREGDSLHVREQRLDFKPAPGGLKIPPPLEGEFGLMVGFNPPVFPLQRWEEGSGSWQLCEAKRTHRRMPSYLSQIRKAFKGQAKPNVVKVVSIVNLHAASGEFEASLLRLNDAKLGEAAARFAKNLPDKPPVWIWCAWSLRAHPSLRKEAVALLSRKYPAVFNFGLDQDAWTREGFEINRGDKEVWKERIW